MGDLAVIEAAWALPATGGRSGRRSPGWWLRRAVGLDEDLLDAADRTYYTLQLVLVVGVAAMATVSLATALSMTLGGGLVGWPLVFGAGFGALVAANDLSIVLPDPHRRAGWLPVAGRLAFSVTFGVLASLPLTATLFSRDVDHAQEQARQLETATAATAFDTTVAPAVRARIDAQTGPAVAAATAARDQAQADLERATTAAAAQTQACNAEITGASGAPAGEGPRAGALCSTATVLSGQQEAAKSRLVAAEQALADALVDQRHALEGALAAARAPVEPYHPGELGVVDRINETHRLLGWWSWAVAGAFVLVDLLPVLRHLTSATRPYETVLASLTILDDPQPTPSCPGPRPTAPEIDVNETDTTSGTTLEDLDAWVTRRRREQPDVTNAQLWREATARQLATCSQPTFNRWYPRSPG